MSNQTSEDTLCCEQIRDRTTRWPRYYRCARRSVVERDGKPYCRQHDPIECKKRRDASMDKFQAKLDEEARVRRLELSAPSLLAAAQQVLFVLDNDFGPAKVDENFPLLRPAIGDATKETR
jgi:hypothetical protein